MTLAVDASVVVACLVDDGEVGAWAAELIADGALVAPHLMPVEVANVFRRAILADEISRDVASLAHADLLDLRVAVFPYEPFGERVWELRPNVTAYDAWYVALAESLSAPLATLDRRLQRAPGLRCELLVPPA